MLPFFLAYLFNIYTEDITRDVGEKGGSVDFNELNVHGHKIMRTILSCYPMVQWDYLILLRQLKCKKKAKLMKTNKTKEDRQIEMEWVSKYVYLGSTISGDEMGLDEIEGMKRLAMATNQETNKLSKLREFLSNGQDPQTKLRILRTCIFPIVT